MFVHTYTCHIMTLQKQKKKKIIISADLIYVYMYVREINDLLTDKDIDGQSM